MKTTLNVELQAKLFSVKYPWLQGQYFKDGDDVNSVEITTRPVASFFFFFQLLSLSFMGIVTDGRDSKLPYRCLEDLLNYC